MKRIIILTILSLTILVTPNFAIAARVSFQPNEHLSRQQNPFTTTVILDTAGDSINTVEGMVKVDPKLVEGIQVSDSGSVVTYWITRPTFDAQNGVIKFAGAIPGGYNGGSGILFTIIFKPYSGEPIDGAAIVSKFTAFKNDGMASSAQISSGSFNLGDIAGQIDEGIASQLYLDQNRKDEIPPEVFSPQISRDESIEGGRWVINFHTVDKQSGIDHYEIQETLTGSLDSGKWRVATNPYVLEDQGLHSFVYVIAIDRQGNERIIKVFPRNPLPWHNLYGKQIIAIILLAVAGTAIYYRHRSNVKRKAKQKL